MMQFLMGLGEKVFINSTLCFKQYINMNNIIFYWNHVTFLVFVEVYGCQMNVNDTEIVHSILQKHNYSQTDALEEASIVLLMTCAIREGAERKIWDRLHQLKRHKLDRKTSGKSLPLTVGVIGSITIAYFWIVVVPNKSG